MQYLKILILFSFSMSLHAYKFQGQAHSPGNKDYKYYVEDHLVKPGEKGYADMITTNYIDPKGQPIGKLVSDFSISKLIPNIIFEDYRTKEKVVSKLKDGHLYITVTSNGKIEKEKKIKLTEKMFFSQGWHNCVIQIINSKNYGVQYYTIILEGDVDTVEFKVESKKNPETNRVEFTIGPKNFFLRFITGNLEAHYDESSKRLMYFKGLTNILDEKQKRFDAEINYTHF